MFVGRLRMFSAAESVVGVSRVLRRWGIGLGWQDTYKCFWFMQQMQCNAMQTGECGVPPPPTHVIREPWAPCS